MYETLNKGTILEPKSLQTKEQLARYWVSLVEIGVIREVWIGGPQKHLGYRKQSPMKGIRFDVYPREGLTMLFKHHLLFKNMGKREIQGTNYY